VRLLLVEDEARLVELVKVELEGAGFAVDAVGRCADAHSAFTTSSYDAAILDLRLPDGDGLIVLAKLRSSRNTIPILILTARDAVEDRVAGLDGGADDYLVKPFAITELIARVRALLRRPGGALGNILDVMLDSVGRDAWVARTPLALTRRECSVLEYLLRRQGRVVPKSVLEDKLYGIDDALGSNAVPVHVHHLRRKFLAAGATVEIHTVRGIGYLLGERK
jgi:DNA-binding response OmpR family regulator